MRDKKLSSLPPMSSTNLPFTLRLLKTFSKKISISLFEKMNARLNEIIQSNFSSE